MNSVETILAQRFARQHRLFWWVAKRSLELALWLDRRHARDQAQAFLEDFLRAVQHRDNPQAAAF